MTDRKTREQNGEEVNQLSVTLAKAFSEGCDARLAGLLEKNAPQELGKQVTFYWRKGWRDVDHYWGLWAKWPVSRLPLLGETDEKS